MPQSRSPSSFEVESSALIARVESGADGGSDAVAAAREGKFGIIGIGYNGGTTIQAGINCGTPFGRAPEMRFAISYHTDSFAVHPNQGPYILAYNRTLVQQPNYPYADLCRPLNKGESNEDREYLSVDAPVRRPVRASRTLYEAARWGSAQDVQHLLKKADVDVPDTLGMTALAWAVARNNRPATASLLAAGADPWAGPWAQMGAVYWAMRFGRADLFDKLLAAKSRPYRRWPINHVSAAAIGGNPAILSKVLAEPHEPFNLDITVRPLPAAASFDRLIADDPALATKLLVFASDYNGDADLVALALKRGADPDAKVGFAETVLGHAAKGIGDQSIHIVDLLLAAGADPNHLSLGDRPLVIAFMAIRTLHGSATLPSQTTTMAIFHRLRAAGADPNLPNRDGVPTIRRVLFPFGSDRSELNASAVTPDLLAMLVQAGVDVNAAWKGQRVLPLVERQAGPSSDLATTLRRLGAIE